MKVALLADIHGNRPALEAVLNDLPPVDGLLFAGDAVGYYPFPNEVCRLLRARGAVAVRGNHDAYVAGELQPDTAKATAYRTVWTREQLAPDCFAWLKSLPVEIRFRWGNRRICLRHASPWDEETYLYPDSSRLADVILDSSEILIVGHTHYPLAKRCGEGLLINPGSVGQPRDRNPCACYAVLDVETATVEHYRVAYDVEGLQRVLAAMNWEPKTIEILSRTS